MHGDGEGEIWGRHPLDIPKNGENQGRIHFLSLIWRKYAKSLTLSCYLTMKSAGWEAGGLSTWIICCKLWRNSVEISLQKHPLNFSHNSGLKWEGKKQRNLFIDKAKQGVYIVVFNGAESKNYFHFVCRPFLHCILAWFVGWILSLSANVT